MALSRIPTAVRASQVCQVFWNVIAWDLVMNFVFGNAEVAAMMN